MPSVPVPPITLLTDMVARCRLLAAHGARSCLSVRSQPLTATGAPSQTSTIPCHAIPDYIMLAAHGWCTFADLYHTICWFHHSLGTIPCHHTMALGRASVQCLSARTQPPTATGTPSHTSTMPYHAIRLLGPRPLVHLHRPLPYHTIPWVCYCRRNQWLRLALALFCLPLIWRARV